MTMRLNACDIYRLEKACKMYQEQTGSEYMWDEYSGLIKKLNMRRNYPANIFTQFISVQNRIGDTLYFPKTSQIAMYTILQLLKHPV